MKKPAALRFGMLLFCSASFFPVGAQVDQYDRARAEEQFFFGIDAFQLGFYSKAILSFESAVTFNREEPLYNYWLGRSYYQSGIMGSAFEQWNLLIDNNLASQTLISFNSYVDFHYRRRGERMPRPPMLYFFHIQGEREKSLTPLLGPTSVTADRDRIYAVDFSGNRIQELNANGEIVNSYRGSLQTAFDHPFDILPLDNGNFIVTEAEADRLLLCDADLTPLSAIGAGGIGPGEMIAPQYLADAGNGYFFSTDWGNRRINKWDYEGNFILSFGEGGGYEPLRAPTGIAVSGPFVYVADMLHRTIYVFGLEGEYFGELETGLLTSPEGLYIGGDGRLYIADHTRILAYDFDTQSLSDIYSGDGLIFQDITENLNGDLITASFRDNRIDFLTPEDQLYNDLFVQIQRIDQTSFPNVRVDFRVLNRNGSPLTGLDGRNIVLFENGAQQTHRLTYQDVADSSFSLNIVPDSSSEAVIRVINTLYEQRNADDYFRIVVNPGMPTSRNIDGRDSLIVRNFLDPIEMRTDEDLTFQYAAIEFVTRLNRKYVTVISDGGFPSDFENFDIADIAALMNNNGIKFNVIYTSSLNPRREDLDYLVGETGGRIISFNEPGALEEFAEWMRRDASAAYSITYRSQTERGVDPIYLPVRLQIRYIGKNGRDELGYLVPRID